MRPQSIVASLLVAAATAATAAGAPAAFAEGQTRPPFGCFKVTADEINIRAKPHAEAAVVGTAKKGDFLVKRKAWCTLRGYWCAVTMGGTEGYADKNFMEVAPCPASFAGEKK